ncbi:MAG: MlaD family protein, partial [Verrucomicrobiota bacterium]
MDGQEKRTELLVGLFVFFGLLILAALIVQFGRFEHQFKARYPLTVTFPDATGINVNDGVRLGGAKVGRVSEKPVLRDDAQGVEVFLEIFDEFQIPEGSEFTIRTSGFMGDSYIAVLTPEELTGEFIEPGIVIEGKRGSMQQLTDTAGEISVKANDLIDDVHVTVKEVKTAVESLKRSFDKLDEKILGDENTDNIEETLANFKETSANLKEATAKIEPLLEKAKDAAGNASDTFEKTSALVDDVSPEVKEAVAELKEALANVNDLVAKIEKGDGLATALVKDSQLRNDLSAFAANVREHGILRYKDTAPQSPPPPPPSSSASSSAAPPTPQPAPQESSTGPARKKS